MEELVIAPLEKKDIPEAADVLSTAMLSVPLFLALFQGRDEEARKVLRQMSDDLLRHSSGVVFAGKLERQIVGVMHVTFCHGGRKASPQYNGEMSPQDTASRIAYWQEIWAQYHPAKPHWHLGPVGVLPQQQASGIGTSMLRYFCRDVDAHKAAGYLETDRPWIVSICQRHGFQVVDQADIFDVKNYFMWRPPVDQQALLDTIV